MSNFLVQDLKAARALISEPGTWAIGHQHYNAVMTLDIPKAEWGEGPWQHEPDVLGWMDETTGLNCRIRRGPVGALCGYVGLPPTHPACGLSYDGCDWEDVQEHYEMRNAEWRGEHGPTLIQHVPHPPTIPGIGEAIKGITCHGGLTYAGPEEGPLWWFGFDCAHAGDLAPGLEALSRHISPETAKSRHEILNDAYRTIDYVREECTELAQQFKALETHAPRRQFADPADNL